MVILLPNKRYLYIHLKQHKYNKMSARFNSLILFRYGLLIIVVSMFSIKTLAFDFPEAFICQEGGTPRLVKLTHISSTGAYIYIEEKKFDVVEAFDQDGIGVTSPGGPCGASLSSMISSGKAVYSIDSSSSTTGSTSSDLEDRVTALEKENENQDSEVNYLEFCGVIALALVVLQMIGTCIYCCMMRKNPAAPSQQYSVPKENKNFQNQATKLKKEHDSMMTEEGFK